MRNAWIPSEIRHRRHHRRREKIWKAIRICSRATISETTLIRLLTTDRKTRNTLLPDGFTIYRRRYLVEESHAPQLQPRQCTKGQKYNHTSFECKEEIKCGKCGRPRPLNMCKSETAECSNCKGKHPTWTQMSRTSIRTGQLQTQHQSTAFQMQKNSHEMQ